jgi:O-antigen/teichoic acid export membrane protein
MTTPPLFERAAHSAYYSVPLKAVFQVLSLIATIQLVRLLSKTDYGVYSLLFSTIALLQIVGSFGLLNVLQRFLPEYLQLGQRTRARQLVVSVCLARFIVSALVLAALLFSWDELAPLVKIAPYRDYFLVFTIAIFSFQQWGLFKVALEASFGHRQTMTLQVVSAVIRIAGYFVAGRLDNALLAVLLVDCVSYGFLAVSHLLLYVRNQARVKAAPEEGAHQTRRLVRYGAYSHFNDAGLQLLDTGVDNILLGYFMDLQSVAAYTFCDNLARKLSRLSPVAYLGDVIRPLLFAKGQDIPQDRLDAAVQVIIKMNVAYYVPLFCAVLLLGEDLIYLLFGKYQEYHLMLSATLGFVALTEIGFALGLVAQLNERVDVLLYSKVAGIYNLAADVVLIPMFGVMGAVVATGTASMLKNVFIWWFLRSKVNLAQPLRDAVRCALYWVIWTAGLALALRAVPGGLRLPAGAIGFAGGFVIYMVFAYKAGADELRMLAAVQHKNTMLALLYSVLARGRTY